MVPIHHDVPQSSIIGSLLFLIYINDLNGIINFSKIHYFVDDRNILYTSNSLKSIEINCDLKSFTERLTASKISLNSNKTELLLFRSKDKKIPKT